MIFIFCVFGGFLMGCAAAEIFTKIYKKIKAKKDKTELYIKWLERQNASLERTNDMLERIIENNRRKTFLTKIGVGDDV